MGEYPQAADTAGISGSKVRYLAVVASGCLASLGGAYLSLVQVKYFEGMTARRFIAIAALIFGNTNYPFPMPHAPFPIPNSQK